MRAAVDDMSSTDGARSPAVDDATPSDKRGVAVEGGTSGEPRLPTLGAAQPFDGLTGVLAITFATPGALFVSELPPLLDGHPSALLSFFFNDRGTPEISPLPLQDALPI